MDTVLQAAPRSAADEVSGDPQVLQIEIFPPRGDGLEMGPNQILGVIDGRLGIVTQFKPTSNKKTDFTFESNGITNKIIATLHGDSPPYTVEFAQSVSPVEPPKASDNRQKVEFPVGKLTRVRLFDLVEIRGFYGNPQQKRP